MRSILNRGAGTSLSGETVNFAVVIDHSKYLRDIGEPDAERRLITVEAGAINAEVNKVAGKANLIFGPDPSTHAYCTIGGNIGKTPAAFTPCSRRFMARGRERRTTFTRWKSSPTTALGSKSASMKKPTWIESFVKAGARARSTPSSATSATAMQT